MDRKTAKSLFTKSEFELYELAQPKQLAKLTAVELSDLVVRSREIRNKWIDSARKQRRNAQTASSARQTSANARSDQKAEGLSELHQVFVERQKEIADGTVMVPMGTKKKGLARSDRQATHRVERSVTRDSLSETTDKLNASRRTEEKLRGKSSSIARSDAQENTQSTKKTTVKLTKKPSKKKTVKTKKAASAKAVKKRPSNTPSDLRSTSKTKTSKKPATHGPTVVKEALVGHNRTVRGQITKVKVAHGGAKRIQAHASSLGKRSQARRDAKR
jgi:hypothetical protein